MDDMSSAEIKSEFRFGHSELPFLAEVLKIPQYFVCSNGTVASGMEGLLMLLKRFAYPCRLSDMIPRFGRSVPEISLILAEVTDHIYRFFSLNSFIFCCEVYGTNVHIERTYKDLPKAYLKYRTDDIAHCFLMNKLFERFQI